jgi:hypothetical protein
MFGATAYMPGSAPASNAAKSKQAKGATDKAMEASKNASNDDWKSHQEAARAHRDAQWSHQDAGNATQAMAHKAHADVHQEKADQGRQASEFAHQQGQLADGLSKKAEMAAHGPDPEDPRTPQQLHQDAARAHEQAGQAHQIAGDDRGAKYHAAKADMHERLGQ